MQASAQDIQAVNELQKTEGAISWAESRKPDGNCDAHRHLSVTVGNVIDVWHCRVRQGVSTRFSTSIKFVSAWLLHKPPRLFDQSFSKHKTRLRCGGSLAQCGSGMRCPATALSRVRAMLKKWKLTSVSRGTADADWPAKKACLRPHETKAWPARDHKAPPRFTIFAVRVAVSIKETRQLPENSTTDGNGDTSVTPHLIGSSNTSIYRVTIESIRLLTLNFLVQPCRNFKSPGAAMLLARRAPVPS